MDISHPKTADEACAGVAPETMAQIDFFAVLTLLESQAIVGGLTSVDDLRVAKARLQSLLMGINTKLLTTVSQSNKELTCDDYKELVVMVGSNHAQDLTQQTRSADAEFVVGPSRAPLSVSIENVKAGNTEEIRFECDLFVKDDPNTWPSVTSDDRKCWEEFKGMTGINDTRHVDFFFTDLVAAMLSHITEKYGQMDSQGIGICVDVSVMAKAMKLAANRTSKTSKTRSSTTKSTKTTSKKQKR